MKDMKPLTKQERAELKKLVRKIRTSKATQREFLRAITLTNRDHAEVRATQKIDAAMANHMQDNA